MNTMAQFAITDWTAVGSALGIVFAMAYNAFSQKMALLKFAMEQKKLAEELAVQQKKSAEETSEKVKNDLLETINQKLDEIHQLLEENQRKQISVEQPPTVAKGFP
jgi:hypothetical protein